MTDRSLQQWLEWLETLSPREIVLGLERVDDVLSRLDLKRPDFSCNIAGTNGKGSCAAMLERILVVAGEKTGCYTSPHLVRYNERIRVDGKPCSDDTIVSAFERVESVRADIPLTYFEFGTLAALVAFDAHGVAAQILEVGMGGRLDAVNAVEPDATIITNVGLDHCAWLGEDVESIAFEKAGVIRPGIPVIFGADQVPDAIRSQARTLSADLRLSGSDYRYESADDGTWNWHGAEYSLEGLRRPTPDVDVQLQNAAAVLAVLEASGQSRWLKFELIDQAMSTLNLPGRMQTIDDNRRWLLDVAHNAEAASELADYLAAEKGDGAVTAIFTALGDKNLAGIIAPLCPWVDRWIAVPIEASRAMPAREIASAVADACGSPCLIAGHLDDAMAIAETATKPPDLILVTGSFYVVGPALDELYSRRTGKRETEWIEH